MPMDLQALMHKTFARERCGAMSFGLSPQYSGNVRAVNSLNHDISLVSHFWDIDKQCRPRSDASERNV